MRARLILILYILAVNILGFFMMGIDKQRARKRAFRIPEATLFMIALIGGSIGSIAGMHLFRHKTRHWYFLFGMPAILLLQIILIVSIALGPIDVSFF
ncbi:MAG: DUF1294 domain-containing protein [Lachnospiraceae bacterium]|nr:DUF1294 domain-containing protein [Lachnospiraceae bacterium]